MFAKDANEGNSFEHPDVLVPMKNSGTRMEKGKLTAVLQPASWNVFRFRNKKKRS